MIMLFVRSLPFRLRACRCCDLARASSCRRPIQLLATALRHRRHFWILSLMAVEHVRAALSCQCHECWRFEQGLPVVHAAGAR